MRGILYAREPGSAIEMELRDGAFLAQILYRSDAFQVCRASKRRAKIM